MCVCVRACARARACVSDEISWDVNFWFWIPVIQTYHIYVRNDVRIRGYCAKPKGTHCTTVFFQMFERITMRRNVSQKNWILSMSISLPRSMGGAQHNGLCPPRSPLYSIVDFYLRGHLRDILTPNMASHGTNYALDWSGWCNFTRTGNFSACREFLSDTGFSYAD